MVDMYCVVEVDRMVSWEAHRRLERSPPIMGQLPLRTHMDRSLLGTRPAGQVEHTAVPTPPPGLYLPLEQRLHRRYLLLSCLRAVDAE